MRETEAIYRLVRQANLAFLSQPALHNKDLQEHPLGLKSLGQAGLHERWYICVGAQQSWKRLLLLSSLTVIMLSVN